MIALWLLQAADPVEEIGAITGQWLDYVKFLLVLGAILILAYLTIRFWIPRISGVRQAMGGPIRIVARQSIEPRKNLYVVEIGPEIFCIGTSESRIHFLTSLDAAGIRPLLERQESETPKDFTRFLEKFRKPREGS